MLPFTDHCPDRKLIKTGQLSFLDLFSYEGGIGRKVQVEMVFPGIVGKTETWYLLSGKQPVSKQVDIEKTKK